MEPAIHPGKRDKLRKGIVGAAIIDADHLKVIRGQLREKTQQRGMQLADRLALVVAGHDDRDLAPGSDNMIRHREALHGSHGFDRRMDHLDRFFHHIVNVTH